jgi:hypothetical protein
VEVHAASAAKAAALSEAALKVQSEMSAMQASHIKVSEQPKALLGTISLLAQFAQRCPH